MPKTNLHPEYFTAATITCTCGATYAMGSTKDALRVDLCSACHPFYSGNQKLIDTAGRVDRFREKMATAETMQSKTKKAVKAEVKEEKVEEAKPEVVEEPAEEVSEEVADAPTEEIAEETESNEETPSEEGSEEKTDAADDSDSGKEA